MFPAQSLSEVEVGWFRICIVVIIIKDFIFFGLRPRPLWWAHRHEGHWCKSVAPKRHGILLHRPECWKRALILRGRVVLSVGARSGMFLLRTAWYGCRSFLSEFRKHYRVFLLAGGFSLGFCLWLEPDAASFACSVVALSLPSAIFVVYNGTNSGKGAVCLRGLQFSAEGWGNCSTWSQFLPEGSSAMLRRGSQIGAHGRVGTPSRCAGGRLKSWKR